MSTLALVHVGWKIIEMKNGKPKFMFCALNGSRDITPGVWLHAEHKTVTDGSGTEYESGFHVIPRNLEQMSKYARKFTNFEDKVVVQVVYQNAVPKPTKGSLALLAERIIIWEEDLVNAMPLRLVVDSKQRP